MPTRKELIVERYTALESELKALVPQATMFPSLDEVDTADLVYYITMVFLGVNGDEGFQAKLFELSGIHNIQLTSEVMGEVSPKIRQFVEWLRQL